MRVHTHHTWKIEYSGYTKCRQTSSSITVNNTLQCLEKSIWIPVTTVHRWQSGCQKSGRVPETFDLLASVSKFKISVHTEDCEQACSNYIFGPSLYVVLKVDEWNGEEWLQGTGNEQGYSRDVYNVVETGVNWHFLPERSVAWHQES